MISQKLKGTFLISIPVFIVHGLEEYYTGFYDIDPIFKFFFHYFDAMAVPQATFLLFQIMLWMMLVVAGILLTNDTWRLRLMVLPGLVYFFEFHHFWKALMAGGYYPGVISAITFPIIAFLFWKELLNSLGRA